MCKAINYNNIKINLYHKNIKYNWDGLVNKKFKINTWFQNYKLYLGTQILEIK